MASNKEFTHSKNLFERIFSWIIFFILVCVIFSRSSESLHSQSLKLGTFFWPDYSFLRADIPAPNCNPRLNFDQEVQRLKSEWQTRTQEDLLEPVPFNEAAVRKSLSASQQLCLEAL